MAERAGFFVSAHGRPPTRKLTFERLEDRQLLSLTHLYTFNDGLANDWIGSAHGALFNGAAVAGGQLVLSNVGVTSGQTSVVQYARLPANVLSSGDASIEVWFTASDSPNWARVFDIGNQSGTNGDSYLFFSPQTVFEDSRAVLRPSGSAERIASGPTTDDGTQHMAAIVIDTAADAIRLYVDGAQMGTTPLSGANTGSVNDSLAYLGRSLFNADPGFTGSINELRIHDNVLDDTTIAADAAAGPSTDSKSPLVRQMEYLNRGIVAVRTGTSSAYIGWRLLGTDSAGTTFNLYRSANGGAPVKLNSAPLTQSTNFTDSAATGLNLSLANTYFVRSVVAGVEQTASETYTLTANAVTRQYLNVPIQQPPGATVQMPTGVAGDPGSHDYTYVANDASVGDLDGDGQYEIILKWDPFNPLDIDDPDNNPPRTGEGSSKDNSQAGFTGDVIIDAYKLDGTRLWRINLGKNIRAGAHYTQFLVYDFDGDGRAEVAMRTAPGTKDGLDKPVILGSDNPNADYRNSSGYILSGPEYLTVFNGQTGAAMASVPFSPPRGSVSSWGDSYGNRVDRFLATVAYLDGVRPSIVMARGYYAKTRLTAFDWRNGQLTQRWAFDSTTSGNGIYGGQGNHNLSVGDVDNDGKDEIMYGAAAFDDNGTGMYATGFGHGDAMHFSDMVPSRPGLEVFQIHEPSSVPGGDLRDARTGQTIATTAMVPSGNEGPGRGVALDIDPNHPGYEFWDNSDPNIYGAQVDVQGNVTYAPIYARPGNMHNNFGLWWDADLLRETLDGTTVSDWLYQTAGRQNFTLSGGSRASINGTKNNPTLSADLFGDWREEVIWRRSDNTGLEIWTTTIPSINRFVTLMHDPQYRQAIAWQNVAYNQPPHPGFFLGAGMSLPSTPSIYTLQFNRRPGDYTGDNEVDIADYVIWRNSLGSTTDLRADGDGDKSIDNDDYAVWAANFGNAGPLLPNVVNASGGPASTLPPPPASGSVVEFASAFAPHVSTGTLRPVIARPVAVSAAGTNLALVLLTLPSPQGAEDSHLAGGLSSEEEIAGGSADTESLDAVFASFSGDDRYSRTK